MENGTFKYKNWLKLKLIFILWYGKENLLTESRKDGKLNFGTEN